MNDEHILKLLSHKRHSFRTIYLRQLQQVLAMKFVVVTVAAFFAVEAEATVPSTLK